MLSVDDDDVFNSSPGKRLSFGSTTSGTILQKRDRGLGNVCNCVGNFGLNFDIVVLRENVCLSSIGAIDL